MRIVIDLDGTIAQLKKPNESYADVKPNEAMIKQIKKWKSEGHTIIIYTARHMKTMQNNVEKVKEKIGEITINWLKRYGIPFDEIYFGKPYGDVYIDDLSLPFKAFNYLDRNLENLKLYFFITMAGKSERFFREGYKIPKYMILAKQKTLFEWALSSLPLGLAKNTVFIALKQHDEEFNTLDFIKNTIATKFNNLPYETMLLDHPTDGQAETAYLALKKLKFKNRPILIFNVDSFFESSKLMHNIINMRLRGFDGIIGVYSQKVDELNPAYSYIELNENNYVKAIIEKKIVSNLASTGLYIFNNSQDFVEAFEKLKKNNVKVLNEFYVSSVYNILIEEGKKFIVDYCEKFVSLGTPLELKNFDKGEN